MAKSSIPKERPKILHIIDSGGLYGAEIMLLHLMEAQIEFGLDPVLASIGSPDCGDKPIENEARCRGLQVKTFRLRPGPNWIGAFEILRFARGEKVVLLHSHGYKGNILFGLLPRSLRRLPLVSTIHGWTWTGGWNRMLMYEWLDGLSLRFVDRVVLVNKAMSSHPRVKKLRTERVAVVPNGVSFNTTRPSTTELRNDIVQFAQQDFSIVSVGRLSPEKGLATLLEVVAGLVQDGHDLRLALLGEGRLRFELQQQAEDLGIAGRVLFAGYVDKAEDYLRYFNLFCLPSLTEGLPMVLLEAMAARVPVAASRVGGIPEVLDQGRLGFLFEPAKSESLRGAIIKVMQQPQLVHEQVEKAARHVAEIYSSQAMAEKYLPIYQELLPEMLTSSVNR